MGAAGQLELPQVKILILGPPVVTVKGKLVKINRRELRACLFFLAGKIEPVSRIEFFDIFWPEESEAVARKKLREGLSRLRSTLGDAAIIVTNNDFISLDSARVYVDAHEYSDLVSPILNSSELNSSGVLPEWLYSRLCKAIDLCRGPQFLQDTTFHRTISFENWVNLTNQSFSFSRDKIIERLAEHCIALGNLDEAILWLGKLISFDHLNTDINYLMLNCLRERGRFKEASDFADFLAKIYKEYQPEGLPVILQDMRLRIKREVSTSKKDRKIEWPGAEENAVTFVGRSDLLMRLNNAYNRKGIVYISGEAGSGKNRLVQEFCSRLESKPKLIYCIGKPMIKSSPFAPIIEGMRAQMTEKEWAAVPQRIRYELRDLLLELPELDIDTNNSIALTDSEKPLLKIFNSIHELLTILFEKTPVLMVIDIAKWCDDATLKLLSFLNDKNFFKTHGLLVLISRTEDQNPGFNAFIDHCILANNLERIDLLPFTLEETAQLISVVMGKPVSDALVNKIHKETGGNPFFLIETLRAINLFDFDTANFSKDDLYPVPATIRSMVHEKIHQLSEPAQKVLQSAAVLGRRFLPEVLDPMLIMNCSDFVLALEELQQKNILIGESGLQTAAYYEFSNDQIREVVLQELSPARKRTLHLAAVKALQAVKGEALDLASTFAYHYEQAGDKVKAFSAWCAAGRFARRRFSREDTYAAYQHASELLPGLLAEEFRNSIRQLLIEWGDYAYDLNDDSTCEMLYKMGLETGEDCQDALLIGMALSGLGRVAEMRGEVEDGIELLNRSLFFFSKTTEVSEKIEAYARLGVLYQLKFDFRNAEKTLNKGLEIERDDEDKNAMDAGINLRTQLSLVYTLIGYPAKAEEIATLAMNESRLVNRQSAKVQAGTVLALAQYYEGKYKKSLENATSIYKLAMQLNLDWWVSLLDLIIARDHLIMGQLDESWFHANHSIDAKDPVQLHSLLSHSNAIKGDLYRMLSNFSAAEDQYRLGSQPPLIDFQSLENYFNLGMTLCQEGQLSEGMDILKETITNSESLGLESISLIAKLMLETYLISNPDEYQKKAEPIARLIKERGYGASWMNVDFVNAAILLAKGSVSEAIQIYSKIADSARQINNRWYELWAYSSMARISNQNKEARKKQRARLTEILEEMAFHAQKKPITDLFTKYRINLEKTLI